MFPYSMFKKLEDRTGSRMLVEVYCVVWSTKIELNTILLKAQKVDLNYT